MDDRAITVIIGVAIAAIAILLYLIFSGGNTNGNDRDE